MPKLQIPSVDVEFLYDWLELYDASLKIEMHGVEYQEHLLFSQIVRFQTQY